MVYPGLVLQNRYGVVERLGIGGQCETWLVDDRGTKTKKVLKVLLDNYDKSVELFQREAEVLKQLNHPGIPKVEPDGYFTFQPEGATKPLHCLVMEFIEGQDLQTWLNEEFHKASQATEEAPTRKASQSATQSGQLISEKSQTHSSHQPIAQEQAIDWLKQLVEILAQVHDCNYFHRDIKPSNIMRRPNGQLVLIDFGAVREVTLTFIEKLKGQDVTMVYTPEYAAPEQFQGQAVPQSDFFALGRTFVYLLTGRAPQNPQQYTNNWLLNWKNLAPQVSKPLADLIDDLMKQAPEDRPESAEVILQKLALVSIKLSIDPILSGLPGIMKFWANQILRDEFQKHIKQIQTPKIALYGRSGSGKSSLINAIMGKQVAAVNHAKIGTRKNESHTYYRDGWKLNFVDSRGVGDSEGEVAFQQAIDYIVKEKVDILLFVIPADDRDVYDDVKFLTALKAAHKQQHGEELPAILVLNKIDRIGPGEWNPRCNYNLSLEDPDLSRKPQNIKEAKEAVIRACIQARTEEYQMLIDICVPVCAKWDEWEDRRYNIEGQDGLVIQIYNSIPNEAAKYGFGGAAADTLLKKAVASRYTSVAAKLAFSVVLLPFFDANAVLFIQNSLVSTIAQIAGENEDRSSAAKNLLKQLDVKPTDAKSALSMTFAIGEAAIRHFINKEEIIQVKPVYDREEKKLESEFQEAFKGGKEEVMKKLRQQYLDMQKRYGVKNIDEERKDDGHEDDGIMYVVQSPL